MKTNNQKTCMFCNTLLTKVNRSKEHVMPQWLLDYLEIRNEKIQPTHFSATGETKSIRYHTLEGLLAGQVCEKCNSGWMSILEQSAIPILKSLIDGDITVIDLNDNERIILGRWTAKTAFTLNSSSNYFKNIPSNHYKYIKNNETNLPPNVACFGQQHHGERKFYWIQCSSWLLHGHSNNLEKIGESLIKSSYKISFQFGKLLLLLSYLPLENIYPVLWKGIHIPLLPKSGKCSWYENNDFNWYDSEQALIAFHNGFQAILIE
jgi:hypothetical protein